MKKQYYVGIKIINAFYVEADSEEKAEQIVREYDPYDTLKDCDFNIEYVELTDDEGMAWQIKHNEVDWAKLNHKDDKNDFLDDANMMADFEVLNQVEFLETYPHVTEREYEETKRKLNKI